MTIVGCPFVVPVLYRTRAQIRSVCRQVLQSCPFAFGFVLVPADEGLLDLVTPDPDVMRVLHADDASEGFLGSAPSFSG